MPIGNIADKVSKSALDKMDSRDNKPSVEPGFEDGMDFSSLFDSIEEDFGAPDSGQDGFSSSFDVGTGVDNNSFSGASNTFGNLDLGGQFNIGNMNQQQQPVIKKKSVVDLAMDASGEAAKSGANIVKDMIKSIALRNYDDFAGYSASLAVIGGVTALLGFALGLTGVLSGVRAISFASFPFDIMMGGGVASALGIAGIGCSALGILGKNEPNDKLSELPDIPIENKALDNFEFETDEALWNDEEEYASMLDGVFGGSQTETEDDVSITFNENEEVKGFELTECDFDFVEKPEVSTDELMENLPQHVAIMNRKELYNIFKGFFHTNTPGFSDKLELDIDSDEFKGIRATVFEALAAASKQDIDDIDTEIESIVSTFFCYVIKVRRIKGLTKLEDVKREMEAYFRDSSEDISVVATVSIERNCYKITLTKGISAIVTVGDCLKIPEVESYMLNESNELPFLAGIDEYGNAITANGRNYTTMLIAGKQRSGKSWYVNSIIMTLMAFNSPEDVEFLIIDPKESTLFKTIACMPHVCGLHNDNNIITILQDIIEKEGKRRKKIMADNVAEDIWDLRKRKGIKIPILYIVIDEFMTVLSNLSINGMDKELVEILHVIITQLPSSGIHLLFVPHRAQGVVDKTTRANMLFTAAVRADIEIVKETLDDKRWDRLLTQPGDTALKMVDIGVTKFVRGAAIATSNSDNMTLIENMAKAYYKIGVDIPNMRTVGAGYNRNEQSIKHILMLDSGDSEHVKYDSRDNAEKLSLHGSIKDWLDDEVEDVDELLNEASLDELNQ